MRFFKEDVICRGINSSNRKSQIFRLFVNFIFAALTKHRVSHNFGGISLDCQLNIEVNELKVTQEFRSTKMSSASETMDQQLPLRWYQYISVEPTMFLYMFAFQLTSVIEQAFFVRRACMVNHNYSAHICDNLANYTDIQKEVQVGFVDFITMNHSRSDGIFPLGFR